jgi:phosphatidylglycerophosphate synthase
VILFGYVAISFLLDERPEVQPTIMGKLSTVFQLVTVGVVLLMLARSQLLESWLDDALIYLTAATTVISGVQYLYLGLLRLQNRDAL